MALEQEIIQKKSEIFDVLQLQEQHQQLIQQLNDRKMALVMELRSLIDRQKDAQT